MTINMDGVDCKKPYFDATLEALVKQDIRYGLKPDLVVALNFFFTCLLINRIFRLKEIIQTNPLHSI